MIVKNYIRAFGFAFAFVATFHPVAFAQLPTPDLSRIHPPAARVGETVDVSLYGSNLEELRELRFTHPGITAQRVTQAGDEFFPEPRPVGSSFSVTVAADVPPGIYEARAVCYLGISTARPFVVAPKDSNEVAESGDHSEPDKAMPIELDSVIFGAVPSSGIDWFRFTAMGGQRTLLEIHAERIDSRMDGLLIVYDAAGREVTRNRERYGRDPFLEVSPENDTEYFLAVSDILYRGGSEHFYRLRISNRPHIDFVFPPAGEPGSTGTYTLYGRNLPGGRLTEDVVLNGQPMEILDVEITLPGVASIPAGYHSGQPRQGLLRGFDYRIADSNAVRIGFATAPVVTEQADTDSQKVTVPAEVAGRFNLANDEDVYRFTAQKGKTYSVEVIADRMASKVDSYLIVEKVTSAEDGSETMSQIADSDDMPSFFRVDGKDSINPDTSDSAIVFTSDHDGDYVVTIVNQFGNGGPSALYRLAIREPLPDFDLLATFERPLPTGRTGYSATPVLRRGATAGIRIIAPRQDGFDGDIVVTAEGLPEGVTATPLKLSGKTDQGILVVSAAEDANSWAGTIQIVGRARAGDRELVREARFATLVWGHIFADSIRVRSRLTEQVPLSVNEYEEASVVLKPAEDKEWTVELGQKLELPVTVTDNGTRTGTLTVEPHGLFGLHRGAPTVNVAQDATESTLTINFTKNGNFDLQPGRYQFVLHGTGVTKYRKNVVAVERAEAELKRIEELIAKREVGDKAAQSAKKTAEADLKAAKSAATEKNTSFAVWSDQITVNVVEPEKK